MTAYDKAKAELRLKGMLTDDEPPKLTPLGHWWTIEQIKALDKLYAKLASDARKERHAKRSSAESTSDQEAGGAG